MRLKSFWLGALGGTMLLSFGCGLEEYPRKFEKNLVYAYRLERERGVDMTKAQDQTNVAILEMFGTPDEPTLPALLQEEDFADLVSMENLKKAAGPANDAAGTGLYDKHCVMCHGTTGEGRGIAAALSDPYPRDYRMGVFKFKSTPRGSKPTKADLARVIRHGVPGTVMKAYDQLKDEEVASLVDYVIYLSMRGETERRMLFDGADSVDWEVDNLYDYAAKKIDPEKTKDEKQLARAEAFAEQKEYIDEHVADIADAWLSAEDRAVEATVPEGIAVFDASKEQQSDEVKVSIDRGKQLFVGAVAACAKCHGESGRGDGQTTDFDDWAKDWTVNAKIQPTDEPALIPFIARGALPPRVIRPRNFRQGLFRGGNKPEELYRRIILGIDGTPMPAVTIKSDSNPAGLTEQEVWDLVNYILSLAKEGDEQA